MFLFPSGLLLGGDFTFGDYLLWNEIPTVIGNLVGGLAFRRPDPLFDPCPHRSEAAGRRGARAGRRGDRAPDRDPQGTDRIAIRGPGRVAHPDGDRVEVVLNGKFLPYQWT
jgi:hypothetical protein